MVFIEGLLDLPRRLFKRKTIEELIIDNKKISRKLIRERFSQYDDQSQEVNPLDKIVEAFEYSNDLFKNKLKLKRACGNPYFIHPFTATKILRDLNTPAPSEAIIVALLHDILEETKDKSKNLYEKAKTDIKTKFGEEIYNLVNIVSTNFYEEMNYQAQIKKMFSNCTLIKHGNYKGIENENLGAIPILLKLADAIDNVETIYTIRKDLYSKGIKKLGYKNEIDGVFYLKPDSQEKRIQKAIIILNETYSYLNDKSCIYKDQIKGLYERLRQSLIRQVENEIECIQLEIDAETPEDYKKAVLLGIFEKNNKKFLEECKYNPKKIKRNMYKIQDSVPIAMPRHKYLLNQISKSKIKQKDLDNYKRNFIPVLTAYKEILEKIQSTQIYKIEPLIINSLSAPSPHN